MSPRWMTRSMVGSALILSTSSGSSARLTGPYGKSPITAYVVWPLLSPAGTASRRDPAALSATLDAVGSVAHAVAERRTARKSNERTVGGWFMGVSRGEVDGSFAGMLHAAGNGSVSAEPHLR